MPDRKEPHLRLPDDEHAKPSKKDQPAQTAQKPAPSTAPGALKREASEAARAEVRRRLAEKNAAQSTGSDPSAANHEQPAQRSSEPKPSIRKASGGGGGQGESPPNNPGGSSGFPWLAGLALLLAAAGLAFGGWQYQRAENQQNTLESLGGRIQELEIRLSETGQDLSEAGSTFSEKLEWADSEIRKLWVVAHQRNRPAIAELEEKMTGLESQLAGVQRTADQATQKTDQVSEQLKQQASKLDQQLSQLSSEVQSYSSRLAEVSLTTSTLSQQVRDQDRRQQVTRLDDDLQNLTRQVGRLSEEQASQLPDDLAERLSEYEEILASLEASRSQLTSRVTRLMDEVRELQQGR